MIQFSFVCPLPNGVHARPASAIEEVARPFSSAISISNKRTGQAANAKSVLAIVGIDIRFNDPCVAAIQGPDEQAALARLTEFLNREFPHCDDAIPVVEAHQGALELPPLLRQAKVIAYRGTAVVPGIALGKAVRLGAFALSDAIPRMLAGATAEQEIARVDAAIGALVTEYETALEQPRTRVESDVLRAHRSVARDPEFKLAVERGVLEQGRSAAGAIEDAEAHFSRVLLASGSALLRERVLDVRDVCRRLAETIYGGVANGDDVRLTEASVCLAEALTPGQFLALDRQHVKGLVLEHGGTTSHTVILARSFGIPTLVGVTSLESAAVEGQDVAADADLGALVTNLTDAARRYYGMEHRRLAERSDRLRQFSARPARTADGCRLEVAANIGTAAEAPRAFEAGAEGIGLFRTEMLFVDRNAPPTEDEQFEEYRQVLMTAGDRPVIIRTLDVGGDKPIAYLHLPAEDNPFLGYRAVRMYSEFEEIFRSQIRALVRASAFGSLCVMVPMVSRIEEVRWVRAVVADEQARAVKAGIAFDETMQLGAMVEVPSVAFLLDHLAAELDFFSIGSNDLLQYFAAVDRANQRIAALSNPLDPAFLRLLAKIVDDGHAHGRWVGLCGEMGGQPRALPLLVGLGLDEISMAAPAIPRTKAAIAELTARDCEELVRQALACASSNEVVALVDAFQRARPAPLVDADLVFTSIDARSKEEAIKLAVDRLFVVGRTEHPRDIEDAVWRREAIYSTGFGYGFAIPHCKTDAVNANSLVVAKLEAPVEWGSLDEKPVGVLILLAIRESDQATEHMKVLARLARKVMHEEFRDRLVQEDDARRVSEFLRQALE